MRQIGETARSLKIVQKAIGANPPSFDGLQPELACDRDPPEEIDNKTTRTGDLCLPTVRTQADVFLNAIDDLKSVSDRVCDQADRDAERAGKMEDSKRTELADLRLQLKEESLKARGLALRELEEAWKAKLELVQNQIRRREAQVRVREGELTRMASKIYGVVNRLNQTESESQSKAEQLEAEIADLKHQLKERDERLAAKKPAREAELEHIKQLEDRLQSTEENLQSRDAELKEKDKLIQAATAKEAELGKLIDRLSSECEKLTAESHDKTPVAEQVEKKQQRSSGDFGAWKKILARIQEQPFGLVAYVNTVCEGKKSEGD
jgi:chromosome segregation ATPase